MHRSRVLGTVALALLACPHAPTSNEVREGTSTRGGPDAGHAPTEADLLLPKVEALAAEASIASAAVEEALWRHWTTGAPLDLAGASAGHDALFSKASVELLRRAQKLHVGDTRRVHVLELHIVGELLARALTEEDTALANLEATATFSVDGREHAWRDLNRDLLTEKSAVKRRAVWTASLKAAERIDAALGRREAKVHEALAGLDLASPLELVADMRDVELDVLAQASERLLAATDAPASATLKRLSDAELKLPVDKLSRADLPRLLRTPSAVDAAFPRVKVAAMAVQTLAALGLYGRAGLTLDLSESAKKNPLPLTVALSPADVRVSFRPLGGLRDEGTALSALGRALALQHRPVAFDPLTAEASGELFSSLLREPAWLEDATTPPEVRLAVSEAVAAQRLFALRRAAGVVLARIETQGLPEPEARAKANAVIARALGVRAAPDDAVRWRIDSAEVLHAASLLRATLAAEAQRAQLVDAHGPTWWRSGDGGVTLTHLWARADEPLTNTQLTRVLESLGAAELADAGADQAPAPLGVSVDAGVDAGVGGVGGDGGVRAVPWPQPQKLLDPR